jgi:hypothetical protein
MNLARNNYFSSLVTIFFYLSIFLRRIDWNKLDLFSYVECPKGQKMNKKWLEEGSYEVRLKVKSSIKKIN